jgi:RNA polymerase sigma factor (sigma-70 family)
MTSDEQSAIVHQEAKEYERGNREYRAASLEDYRQEGWLAVLTALPKLEIRPDILNLGAALRISVRNHLRQVGRAQRKSVMAGSANASEGDTYAYVNAADERASTFDLLAWVVNRLRDLDEKAADAFEMRFGSPLSIAEIAGKLGKSCRTVNRALASAWRLLPKILDDVPVPGKWEIMKDEDAGNSDRGIAPGPSHAASTRSGARGPEGRDRSPEALAGARRARRSRSRSMNKVA